MTSEGDNAMWSLGAVNWRSPLTFLTATGDRIHCPMVLATVGEVETRLIVDTGTSTHVLTRALADEAGLPSELGEPGHDVAGHEVPSYDVGDVQVKIAGATVTLSGVVAIDGPPPFSAWGIGGFLSPQQLWPSSAITVDLTTNQLARFDSPTSETPSPAGPSSRSGARGRYGHGCGLPLVPVRVNDGPDVVVFLDSGAASTEVDRSAVPDLADAPIIQSGAGVGGSAIAVAQARRPEFWVAGALLPLDVLMVRDGFPAPEGSDPSEMPKGLIGMDLLDQTTLLIGPEPDRDVLWYWGSDQT